MDSCKLYAVLCRNESSHTCYIYTFLHVSARLGLGLRPWAPQSRYSRNSNVHFIGYRRLRTLMLDSYDLKPPRALSRQKAIAFVAAHEASNATGSERNVPPHDTWQSSSRRKSRACSTEEGASMCTSRRCETPAMCEMLSSQIHTVLIPIFEDVPV